MKFPIFNLNRIYTWILLGTIPLLLFSNCESGNQEKNVQLIENYINAVQDKDINIMSELLAEDYEGFGPSLSDSINKDLAVQMWKQNATELYDEIVYETSRNIAITIKDGAYPGEWVTNWAIMKISYKNGRGPIRTWANSIYQIENGKIRRSYTFYNEADVMEQLGYVFIDVEDLYND